MKKIMKIANAVFCKFYTKISRVNIISFTPWSLLQFFNTKITPLFWFLVELKQYVSSLKLQFIMAEPYQEWLFKIILWVIQNGSYWSLPCFIGSKYWRTTENHHEDNSINWQMLVMITTTVSGKVKLVLQSRQSQKQ